jgi:hypothetical protein
VPSRTAPAAGTLVGRAPGGDATGDQALLPRFAWQAVDASLRRTLNPECSEQRGLAGRLRGIFLTSGGSVNTTTCRSAYSKAFAAFSPMSGTSRFILIRARAGVK